MNSFNDNVTNLVDDRGFVKTFGDVEIPTMYILNTLSDNTPVTVAQNLFTDKLKKNCPLGFYQNPFGF